MPKVVAEPKWDNFPSRLRMQAVRGAEKVILPSKRPLSTLPSESTQLAPSVYLGRFAPSPTGLLHLGHVRTFATAARRARVARGMLRLRMDDLDPQRSRVAWGAAAIEDLLWLGFEWIGEPRWQSHRKAHYQHAWAQLVAGGWLYPCRCTRRELLAMASAPHEGVPASAAAMLELPPSEAIYPGLCRPAWKPGEAAGAEMRAAWLHAGPAGQNWRFRVPNNESVCFADGNFGLCCFVAGRQFGDFPVWRRDDVPAYQLATVVDEAEMGITEVVRGADLLLSTARQLLLFRALGVGAPAWFHCPLVTDSQGVRLAKRDAAVSIRALRERGLSPTEVLAQAHAESTANDRLARDSAGCP